MLLRFVAKNFLSIADELELNMFPAPRLRKHPDHVYQTPQVDLLKAAAIYGANGAGKSNIIIALNYLKRIIIEGKIESPISFQQVKFRLIEKYLKLPIHFEIEFFINGKYYSYGIEFDEQSIFEEWLYELDIKSEEEELIFERKLVNEKIKINIHKKYLKTEKDKYRIELYEEEMLDKDIPLIYFIYDKGFEDLDTIPEYFFDQFLIIYPDTNTNFFEVALSTNTDISLELMNSLISKLDTGVKNISFITAPLHKVISDKKTYEKAKTEFLQHFSEFQDTFTYSNGNYDYILSKNDENEILVNFLVANHKNIQNKDIPFLLTELSDGTNRLFDLLPIIDWLKNNEGVMIIDEIGRSLHPSLLKKLVTLIMKTPTKGQIIFTTHDSHLLDLDIFRPDEIWFVEKGQQGRSKAYPMSDFKPRYDENIERGYLMGRFGAIPYLGDLDKLDLTIQKEPALTS